MLSILENIKKYDTIIIHRHVRPDGDCLGSQIGLKEIIKCSFPNKNVYVVGEELTHLKHLGEMDTISDDEYAQALVITVDVANTDRISDGRYNLGQCLMKIDHHPNRHNYADIEWVDPSYSSCCEMIVDFYIHHQDALILNKQARLALYHGMVTDTNRFLNITISKRTFQLASILLEESIDVAEIYRSIYNVPLRIARFRGYALTHLKCTTYGVGYIKIDEETANRFGVTANDSGLLTSILSNINEVKVLVIAIYDSQMNQVRVSLRSGDVPIQVYAEKYGGGGHKHASGLLLKDFTEVDALIADLDHGLIMY